MALRLEHVKWDLPDENGSGLNKEIIKDITLEFGDGRQDDAGKAHRRCRNAHKRKNLFNRRRH